MITSKSGHGPQYYDPDEFNLTPDQKTWIQDHLDEFETVLLSGSFADPVNGYAKYINVENLKKGECIMAVKFAPLGKIVPLSRF